MNKILIGALVAGIVLAGCTTVRVDESQLDRYTETINGTSFGPDCFKDGYDTAYTFRCEDGRTGETFEWVACADGDAVNFPEKSVEHVS